MNGREASGRWLLVRTIRMAHRAKPSDPPERMETWLDHLTALGYLAYYPMIREKRPVPSRELSRLQRAAGMKLLRARVVPFLPQWVFVAELAARAGYGLVSHPGVVGILEGEGGVPRLIPGAVIDALREREIDGVIPGATPKAYIFRPGERAEVINGAFTNQVGIVEAAPDATLQDIDADDRLRLVIGSFRLNVSVSEVRHV